jgi:hypothetical protein
MAVHTCFACNIKNDQCVIFQKNCPYNLPDKCEYYYSKRWDFPEDFKSYMEIVNMLAQARANITQQKFNKYILILSTTATTIAVISLVISLII